jgi:recombination protein RecR
VSELPEPIERLVALLSRLPGIGRRSAQRIAFQLVRQPHEETAALAAAIGALPDALGTCPDCGNWAAAGARCAICLDPRRDRSVVCVVEQADNLAAIERTSVFRGLYHVLGGAISPLKAIGPAQLRIESLLERLREPGTREVILATNPTVEGEATALYIARLLSGSGLEVSRPATGLPVGGELDYVDGQTLSRALEGRRTLLD